MDYDLNDAIVLNDLTKYYGKSLGIKNINLTVHRGEIFGFLGPNGAGKTTTINLILDLLRPTSGHVKLFGQDVRTHGVEIRKHIGFLAGDMTTDPNLTGGQYINFCANQHKINDKEYINKLIKEFKCETNKKIKKLSRGNKQKIGLVAALMHQPEILVLDEPTSGLDPLIQDEFIKIIRNHQKQGKTTFISSHILSEVQEICDRVGFIKNGELKVEKLENIFHKSARKIQIKINKSSNVIINKIKNLDGVDKFSANSSTVNFYYSGDFKELISLISNLNLIDIQILEPSLDDLFRKYYKGKG